MRLFAKTKTNRFGSRAPLFVPILIAYWISVQPLGRLLGEAIDGGEVLHESLWHPFRVPKVHNIESVSKLYPQLQSAWSASLIEEPLGKDDWYYIEISKVVNIFGWAHSRGECVVSFVQQPQDAERARRVVFPKLA